MRVSLLIALALAGLLASCTRSDGLYCDEETPCTDPSRPFCDLSGAYPASSGVGRTCIADPNQPDVDGGGFDPDAAPDAAPMCLMSSECPASEPVCSSGSCAACVLGAQGDSECLARDAAEPVCGASGRCQECNRNDDCQDPLAPICDTDVGTCGACSANSECDSGACDLGAGSCVLAANIIYVDAALGSDGPSCGAQTGSAACRHLGEDEGALVKVEASRKIIVMAPGNYIEQVLISNQEVQIIGNGARQFPTNFAIGSGMSIINGASVSISDLRIQGGNGISEGSGVSCAGSNLTLQDVTLENNDSAGLSAIDCALDISASLVRANGQQGLRVADGTALNLYTSVIENNGFQGVLATESILEILRTRVSKNLSGGLRINNSSFLLENNIIAQNGNASANPSSPAGGIAIQNAVSKTPQIIRHTTVADNSASIANDSAGVVCAAQAPVSAISNIVVNNLRPGADPQFTDNCEFSFSNVGGTATGTGNISVPPIFVNPAAGDYHLAAGSPGIDLGSPSVPTAIDIDGDPRPVGGGRDMGADERL